ncbi:MAG: multidrug ABC transporter ATP-binding protein, partial [Bacillota bacterium]
RTARDTPGRLKARDAGEALRLRLAAGTPRGAAEELARALAAAPEVLEVRLPAGGGDGAPAGGGEPVAGGEGEEWWLRVKGHVAALRRVLDAAEQAGVVLEAVEPGRATLDDVFLAVTGHSLREREEAGA